MTYPIVFDTFQNFDSHQMRLMQGCRLTCWNGVVSVKKYRITIEEVEEANGVVARLQELWDRSDNHHHWYPLQAAAKAIGYELQGSPGTEAKA